MGLSSLSKSQFFDDSIKPKRQYFGLNGKILDQDILNYKGVTAYNNANGDADPDNGTAYRTTDEAKKVIVNFWGLADAYGEGKEYADIDAAIESISGYDLAGAKELFNQAYDKAVEAGYIPANSDAWEIQIIIGQPGSGSSAYYNNGYHLLQQVWTEAVKGTKLENHIIFTQSQPLGSSSFSSYLKNNSIDLLFGVGWTGSALDPYGLIQAYVQESYQYDPAIDYTSIQTEVEIDGVKYTAATYDWYLALSGETITAKAADGSEKEITAGTTAENSLRLAVLAAIEGTVLQQYTAALWITNKPEIRNIQIT